METRTWKQTSANVYSASGHHTFVGEYPSIAQAFTDLKLSMGVHIRFRKEVKAKGHLTIDDKLFCVRHDAKSCNHLANVAVFEHGPSKTAAAKKGGKRTVAARKKVAAPKRTRVNKKKRDADKRVDF